MRSSGRRKNGMNLYSSGQRTLIITQDSNSSKLLRIIRPMGLLSRETLLGLTRVIKVSSERSSI